MSVLKYWDANTTAWQRAIVGAQGATGPQGATGNTITNGTSNVAILNLNGNINLTSNGVTSFIITDTGANLSGNMTIGAGGDLNVGNLVSANSISALTSLFVSGPQTKASTATGATGQICWDADYIYVCVATDTWKRASLTGGY